VITQSNNQYKAATAASCGRYLYHC